MLLFSRFTLLLAMVLLLSLNGGAVLSIAKWTATYAVGTGGGSVANWPMLGYNPEHTGYNVQEHKLNAGNVGKLHLNWRYSINSPVSSPPTLANGVIYIHTNDDKLYAINITTRTFLWSYPTGIGGTFPSIESPAVANGSVYFSSDNLYALNAQTGALQWQYPMQGGYASTPTVMNGIVYISLASSSYGGGGTVFAFDAQTGVVKWQYATPSVIYTSPTVSNGVVYVNSYGSEHGYIADGYAYALDAQTGSLKWSYDIGRGVASYPSVANGVVYLNANDKHAYALNAQTGGVEWKYPLVSSSSPAVDGGDVYIGSDNGYTYALDARTGARKWSTAGNGYGNPPAVGNGVVYIGGDHSKIYALNARTGASLWSFTISGAIWSCPVVVNSMLYMIDFGTVSSVLDVFHVPGVGQ